MSEESEQEIYAWVVSFEEEFVGHIFVIPEAGPFSYSSGVLAPTDAPLQISRKGEEGRPLQIVLSPQALSAQFNQKALAEIEKGVNYLNERLKTPGIMTGSTGQCFMIGGSTYEDFVLLNLTLGSLTGGHLLLKMP